MPDTQGAVPADPSAASQGATASADGQGGQQNSSAGDVASIQQFVVKPSADASNTDGQGANQGGQGQTQAQSSLEEQNRNLQSIADRRNAENLALQQEILRLQMQQAQGLQQRTPVSQDDPMPDPNTDQVGYANWYRRQLVKDVASQVRQENQQWLNGLMGQAQEAKFTQDHPDANIVIVKQFAQARGISNLDDAYVVMTNQQRTAQAFNQGAQQTLNQIRQPQGAVPLRQQPSTQTPVPQGQVGISYESMLRAYNQNPNIENTWPKELKDMFWRETQARSAAR